MANKYSMQHREELTIDKYKGTKLSRHIWDLKDSGTDYTIKWSVLATAPAYNPAARKCHLCLKEKTLILTYKCEYLLNARSELMYTCRHRRYHLLSSFNEQPKKNKENQPTNSGIT